MPNQPGNRGNPWIQSLAVAARQLMNLNAVGITATATTVVALRETHLCVRVQSTALLLHQGLETRARNHLKEKSRISLQVSRKAPPLHYCLPLARFATLRAAQSGGCQVCAVPCKWNWIFFSDPKPLLSPWQFCAFGTQVEQLQLPCKACHPVCVLQNS